MTARNPLHLHSCCLATYQNYQTCLQNQHLDIPAFHYQWSQQDCTQKTPLQYSNLDLQVLLQFLIYGMKLLLRSIHIKITPFRPLVRSYVVVSEMIFTNKSMISGGKDDYIFIGIIIIGTKCAFLIRFRHFEILKKGTFTWRSYRKILYIYIRSNGSKT